MSGTAEARLDKFGVHMSYATSSVSLGMKKPPPYAWSLSQDPF